MDKKFIPNCTVLSMIQPDPLPGSYRHDTQTIDDIVYKLKWFRKMDLMV